MDINQFTSISNTSSTPASSSTTPANPAQAAAQHSEFNALIGGNQTQNTQPNDFTSKAVAESNQELDQTSEQEADELLSLLESNEFEITTEEAATELNEPEADIEAEADQELDNEESDDEHLVEGREGKEEGRDEGEAQDEEHALEENNEEVAAKDESEQEEEKEEWLEELEEEEQGPQFEASKKEKSLFKDEKPDSGKAQEKLREFKSNDDPQQASSFHQETRSSYEDEEPVKRWLSDQFDQLAESDADVEPDQKT